MEDESHKAPGRIMKPCEIPIYGDDQCRREQPQSAAKEPGVLESGFRSAREGVQAVWEPVKGLDEQIRHVYTTGVAHSQASLSQLHQPENAPARAAAVGGFGVLGYALGALRRKGVIGKLFYSAVGLGTGALVAFPQEMRQLADEGYGEAQRYARIAYNFASGGETLSQNEEVNCLSSSSTR